MSHEQILLAALTGLGALLLISLKILYANLKSDIQTMVGALTNRIEKCEDMLEKIMDTKVDIIICEQQRHMIITSDNRNQETFRTLFTKLDDFNRKFDELNKNGTMAVHMIQTKIDSKFEILEQQFNGFKEQIYERQKINYYPTSARD